VPFAKKEIEGKQNMPLCLKTTYRKLLKAKGKRKERPSHDHSIYLFWESFGDKSFVLLW
jgi:hypothetical protein